jgi:hypothetical protein
MLKRLNGALVSGAVEVGPLGWLPFETGKFRLRSLLTGENGSPASSFEYWMGLVIVDARDATGRPLNSSRGQAATSCNSSPPLMK